MTQYTTTSLQRLLGRRALLTVENLAVLVDVLDSRQCWDRVDCLVSPVAGTGQPWVSVERLREAQNDEDTGHAPNCPYRCGGECLCHRSAPVLESEVVA